MPAVVSFVSTRVGADIARLLLTLLSSCFPAFPFIIKSARSRRFPRESPAGRRAVERSSSTTLCRGETVGQLSVVSECVFASFRDCHMPYVKTPGVKKSDIHNQFTCRARHEGFMEFLCLVRIFSTSSRCCCQRSVLRPASANIRLLPLRSQRPERKSDGQG